MRVLSTVVLFSVTLLIVPMGTWASDPHHEHGATEAKSAAGLSQKTCPVMGSPVDAAVFADYKGQRVYFCCKGCIAEFKTNPEKYLKILSAKGEKVQIIDSAKASSKAAEPAPVKSSAASGASSKPATKLVAQKTCPVMGGEIDKKVFADYKGTRVYFCCEGCRAPFVKEPEKYLKKLEALGEQAEKI